MENFDLFPGWMKIKWRRSIFCYLAGYEGLSFIEIERGGGRRCDLCGLLDGVLLEE